MNKRIWLALGILPLLLAGVASAQTQSASPFMVQEYATGNQVTFVISANNISVDNVQATAEIVSNGIALTNATFTGHGQISALVNGAFTLYIFVGGQIVYDQIYPAPSGVGPGQFSAIGAAIIAIAVIASSVVAAFVAVHFDRKNRNISALVPRGESGKYTGAIDATLSIVSDVIEKTEVPEDLKIRADNDPNGEETVKKYGRKVVINTLLQYRENTRAYLGLTDKEWDDIVRGKKAEVIGVNLDERKGGADV